MALHTDIKSAWLFQFIKKNANKMKEDNTIVPEEINDKKTYELHIKLTKGAEYEALTATDSRNKVVFEGTINEFRDWLTDL